MTSAMNRLGFLTVSAAARGPAKIWNSAAAVRGGQKTYFTYTPQVSQVLDREPKWVSADEAVQCIKSGNSRSRSDVFVDIKVERDRGGRPRIKIERIRRYSRVCVVCLS